MKRYLSTDLMIHIEDYEFDHISFHRTYVQDDIYSYEDSIVPKSYDRIELTLSQLRIPNGVKYTKGLSKYGDRAISDHIEIGGYKFVVVSSKSVFRIIVIPEIRFWRIRYIYYVVKRWLESINIKLLKTAYIWELLDTEEYMIMQWKDLKFLKSIRSIYGKTKAGK